MTVTVRRAVPGDAPALVELATAVAAEQEGWLLADSRWRSAGDERRYIRVLQRHPDAALIIDGDRILGDYTAKAYVTKSYSVYSEPSHMELDRAARSAVREKIDQKLYADASRLAGAVGAQVPSSTGDPSSK